MRSRILKSKVKKLLLTYFSGYYLFAVVYSGQESYKDMILVANGNEMTFVMFSIDTGHILSPGGVLSLCKVVANNDYFFKDLVKLTLN